MIHWPREKSTLKRRVLTIQANTMNSLASLAAFSFPVGFKASDWLWSCKPTTTCLLDSKAIEVFWFIYIYLLWKHTQTHSCIFHFFLTYQDENSLLPYPQELCNEPVYLNLETTEFLSKNFPHALKNLWIWFFFSFVKPRIQVSKSTDFFSSVL